MLQRYQRTLAPDFLWVPPSPDHYSIAVVVPQLVQGAREVALGVKGHNSAIVTDPDDFCAKPLESNIEYNAFLAFTADPDVTSIEAQVGPVDYVDPDGEVHDHTFDFRIRVRDGMRICVVVKSADKVRRAQLDSFAREMALQLSPEVGDAVLLVTDEDLPAWLMSNARLIHSARLDTTCPLDADIAARADSHFEPISVRDLIEPFAPKGLRSVARLIYQGRLRQIRSGLIDLDTMVVAAAGREA